MTISSLCLYISTDGGEIFDLGQVGSNKIKEYSPVGILSKQAKRADGYWQGEKKGVVSSSIPRLAVNKGGKT
jgi:hypothetical protein